MCARCLKLFLNLQSFLKCRGVTLPDRLGVASALDLLECVVFGGRMRGDSFISKVLSVKLTVRHVIVSTQEYALMATAFSCRRQHYEKKATNT